MSDPSPALAFEKPKRPRKPARQSGAGEDDFSRLTVALRGQVSRSAFGADGWAGMVGDVITLDILARIQRAGG